VRPNGSKYLRLKYRFGGKEKLLALGVYPETSLGQARAKRDPCPDLRGALPPVKQKHFSAVIEPKAIGVLLRAIDGYQGQFVACSALKLAPLVFVRPGELRKAEWLGIDLDRVE